MRATKPGTNGFFADAIRRRRKGCPRREIFGNLARATASVQKEISMAKSYALQLRALSLVLSGLAVLQFSFVPPLSAAGNPYASDVAPQPRSKIDQLVFGRLANLGITPPNLCTDAVFARRVYLDIIGTLPTPKEAAAFLSDTSPDKREALIDRLLDRPEYGEYWGMRWSDLLRVRAEFPINLWPNAAQAYDRWIRDSFRDNIPYNRFVREMLTANGSNFRVGQVNFYRAVQEKTPEGIARAVALTFMGERADKWPAERLAGMSAFFSKITYKPTGEWKEEIVFFDPRRDAGGDSKPPAAPDEAGSERPPAAAGLQTASYEPLLATFPDGKTVKIEADQDPRRVFADWLITGQNPWFARSIVNRLWAWLLGRGIIHEPDDIRPDNPAVNPALLTYLEKELINAKFDLKQVLRLILNSQVYQLAPPAGITSPEACANFAGYALRRLEAEVLIDALNQVTGTTEGYSSPVPEPFTFIPADQRSICLPDASITSSFLEMFGRPSRDTGLMSERTTTPTTDQRLYLLNSSHIQRKIEDSPKLRSLLFGPTETSSQETGREDTGGYKRDKKGKKAGRYQKPEDKEALQPEEAAKKLYLLILSRYPTQEELRVVTTYAESGSSKRDAVFDLAWALINSAEFLYRH